MILINRPWFWIGKFAFYFPTIPLVVITLILLLFIRWSDVYLVTLYQSFVFGILSLIFTLIDFFGNKKLDNFKKIGVCYDAAIVNIFPANWAHIGSYATANVHCVYKDGAGNNCLVKSGYHLLNPSDRNGDLIAKVYVETENPKNYMVELYRKTDENLKIDIDYTKRADGNRN